MIIISVECCGTLKHREFQYFVVALGALLECIKVIIRIVGAIQIENDRILRIFEIELYVKEVFSIFIKWQSKIFDYFISFLRIALVLFDHHGIESLRWVVEGKVIQRVLDTLFIFTSDALRFIVSSQVNNNRQVFRNGELFE